jgi:small subunit ribosomal protein S16
MSVVIRLQRRGRVNAPFFSIVAADKRFKRNGRFLEKIGFYDPVKKNTSIKLERIKFWEEKGAKLTPRVFSLVRNQLKIEQESQNGQ